MFDSDYHPEGADKLRAGPDRVSFQRLWPLLVLHAGCAGVFWVGASAIAVWTAIALYFFRIFVASGVLHRYFSHKTYSTSRTFQFVLAVCANTCAQRGALWWAANHRNHQRHSDGPADPHSPHLHGFSWAHIGWITSNRHKPTDYAVIPDPRAPLAQSLRVGDAAGVLSRDLCFYWWGFDPTYYGLKLLSWTGLIWDLKPVPESVLAEGREADALRAGHPAA